MVIKKLKRAKRHGGISASNYTFSRLQSGVRKGGPAHTLGQSDFISNNIAYDHETGIDDSPLTIIDDTTRDRQAYHTSIPRPYHNLVQHTHAAGLSRNQLNQHNSSSNQSPSNSTNQYGNSPNPTDNTSQQRGSSANNTLSGHREATPANQLINSGLASTSNQVDANDPTINLSTILPNMNGTINAGIEQTPNNNIGSSPIVVPTPETIKLLKQKIPLFQMMSDTDKADNFNRLNEYITARDKIATITYPNKNAKNKLLQYNTLIELLTNWRNSNGTV